MTKIYKMIQTKEELFLAELGINTKEEIELAYGAKIKITDLLKKYETKQLIIHIVSQQRELLIDFCTKLELKAKQYSYLIPDEDFIDEYLKDN